MVVVSKTAYPWVLAAFGLFAHLLSRRCRCAPCPQQEPDVDALAQDSPVADALIESIDALKEEHARILGELQAQLEQAQSLRKEYYESLVEQLDGLKNAIDDLRQRKLVRKKIDVISAPMPNL